MMGRVHYNNGAVAKAMVDLLATRRGDESLVRGLYQEIDRLVRLDMGDDVPKDLQRAAGRLVRMAKSGNGPVVVDRDDLKLALRALSGLYAPHTTKETTDNGSDDDRLGDG
jgi:hypothetical protein